MRTACFKMSKARLKRPARLLLGIIAEESVRCSLVLVFVMARKWAKSWLGCGKTRSASLGWARVDAYTFSENRTTSVRRCKVPLSCASQRRVYLVVEIILLKGLLIGVIIQVFYKFQEG